MYNFTQDFVLFGILQAPISIPANGTGTAQMFFALHKLNTTSDNVNVEISIFQFHFYISCQNE
jgi:hypothetical protein